MMLECIKNHSNIDCWGINKNKTLSKDLIEKYKDKISWREISTRQTLSEDFIRKVEGKVDWLEISKN